MPNKSLLILSLFLFVSMGVFAQAEDQIEESADSTSQVVEYVNKQQIDWDKLVHNFGTIDAYERAEHTFTFTNVSTAPVVILDVKVTCGCTAPSWTQEPVMPGEVGEINIKFNSWKSGVFTKPVTVYTNAADYPTKLFISAIVKDVEGDSEVDGETAPEQTPVPEEGEND